MDNGAVRRTVQSYDRITEEYAAKWFDKPVMEPYLNRFISLVQGRGWVPGLPAQAWSPHRRH